MFYVICCRLIWKVLIQNILLPRRFGNFQIIILRSLSFLAFIFLGAMLYFLYLIQIAVSLGDDCFGGVYVINSHYQHCIQDSRITCSGGVDCTVVDTVAGVGVASESCSTIEILSHKLCEF